MQITTKITFVGFLLAVSTLSVSAAASSPIPNNSGTSGNVEYRLSRITKAIQQREIDTLNTLEKEVDNSIARGFANRGGGGGGFANRGGGGGFVNRGGGGGFANRGGGGGFVNGGGFRNGGGFYNRY